MLVSEKNTVPFIFFKIHKEHIHIMRNMRVGFRIVGSSSLGGGRVLDCTRMISVTTASDDDKRVKA